jgi:drug/metabolite transporter (DMT)-like permease
MNTTAMARRWRFHPPRRHDRPMSDRAARALPALVAGAVAIAFSPIWVRRADVGPVASALLAVGPLWPQSAQGWGVLLGLAWLSHALGEGLIAFALAHLPVTFSSVGLLLQRLVATLLAWVILGEALAWQALGGAVIIAGIALARTGTHRRP